MDGLRNLRNVFIWEVFRSLKHVVHIATELLHPSRKLQEFETLQVSPLWKIVANAGEEHRRHG